MEIKQEQKMTSKQIDTLSMLTKTSREIVQVVADNWHATIYDSLPVYSQVMSPSNPLCVIKKALAINPEGNFTWTTMCGPMEDLERYVDYLKRGIEEVKQVEGRHAA